MPQDFKIVLIIECNKIVFPTPIVFLVLEREPQTEDTLCRILVLLIGNIDILVGDFLVVV